MLLISSAAMFNSSFGMLDELARDAQVILAQRAPSNDK